jgi:hypothetical protein
VKYKVAYTLEGENFKTTHMRYFDALNRSTALSMFDTTMEMTHENEKAKLDSLYVNVSEKPGRYTWEELKCNEEEIRVSHGI